MIENNDLQKSVKKKKDEVKDELKKQFPNIYYKRDYPDIEIYLGTNTTHKFFGVNITDNILTVIDIDDSLLTKDEIIKKIEMSMRQLNFIEYIEIHDTNYEFEILTDGMSICNKLGYNSKNHESDLNYNYKNINQKLSSLIKYIHINLRNKIAFDDELNKTKQLFFDNKDINIDQTIQQFFRHLKEKKLDKKDLFLSEQLIKTWIEYIKVLKLLQYTNVVEKQIQGNQITLTIEKIKQQKLDSFLIKLRKQFDSDNYNFTHVILVSDDEIQIYSKQDFKIKAALDTD